jgi:superfamily II DNA helicase RecQ
MLNSEVSEEKRKSVERELRSNEPSLRLLYATPETLLSERLQAALQVMLDLLRPQLARAAEQ